MFSSKFHCLAEIEALRAGYKPRGVCSPHVPPRLVPIDREPASPSRVLPSSEAQIRAEMDRRIAARLAGKRAA